MWARKLLNPEGQKSFASNELSALGGEPEPARIRMTLSELGFLSQLPPGTMECVLPAQNIWMQMQLEYMLKHVWKKQGTESWY